MSKLTKRITAMLLAGMLVIGSIPGNVFAADADAGETAEYAEEVYTEGETAEESSDAADAGAVGTSEENVADTSEEAAVQYYTVTLDANGGYFENEWDDTIGELVERAEVVTKQVPVGGTVPSAVVPVFMEPDGRTMVFAGWSLERDGELVITGDEEYAPVDNCVLYAVWKAAETEDAGLADTEQETEAGYEDVETGESAQESEDTETAEDTNTAQETAEEEYTASETDNELETESKREDVYADEKEEETSEESADASVVDSSEEGEETVSADAANGVVDSGTCGANVDNLTWTLDEEGTLTISGTGEMEDYINYNSSPWNHAMVTVRKVIIENGVTNVGTHAFTYCRSLTNVTIPNSVTSIGGSVFEGCSGLTNVTIPNSVTSIGSSAFYGCSGLTNVTIPNSVTSIGSLAFYECSGLTSVTISNSVTSIGEGVFGECSSLTSVTIPNSVTSIGGAAFDSCKSLTSVTIPNSVTSIGQSAFSYCSSLTSVIIPNSVTSIEESAFFCCYRLTSVTIQEGVTSIGLCAFFGCNRLTSITIPNSVARIEGGAFSECICLTTVYFNGNAPSISSNAFTNVTATAYYPANNSTWTEDKRQNYGGMITWEPWIPGQNVLFTPVEPASIIDKNCYFRSGLKDENSIKCTFNYDDKWVFSNDQSDRYKLMQTSIRIAMAAYGAKEEIKTDSGEAEVKWSEPSNIKKMMKEMGFSYTDLSINYPEPSKEAVNTIGSAIGLKNIKMEDGTVKSIILLAIRGGGYGAEWGGNFNVFSDPALATVPMDSYGFRLAANQVDERLKEFFKDNRQYISDDLRIWVTGYSRGGATSNLVAADLIDGKCSIDGVDSSEVFAFCFECPRVTARYKNYNNTNNAEKYKNIISIVNPNDFVPYVPLRLGDWQFLRYGITYYLPCSEYTSKYKRNYKSKMIEKYNALLSANDIEINKDVYSEKRGQASLLDRYFNYLAESISTVDYCTKYQDSLIDIAASKLGNSGKPNWKEAIPSITSILGVALKTHKSQADTVRIVNLFTNGDPAPGPNSHYPELCLSWIDSLSGFDDYYVGEVLKYRVGVINCPVNVTVKNSSGEVVGNIIDNEIQEIEDGIVVRIDEDGQKIFILPPDEEYTIDIQGTDNGKVNYTIEEYNPDTYSIEKVINYKDIEILQGTEIFGTVTEAEISGVTETTLQFKQEETIIEPDEILSGEEVVKHTVDVSYEGNGNVIGGGNYVHGEFAKVTAEPDEGYKFSGWYKDDICINTEKEYRFGVNENTVLIAKFIPTPDISYKSELLINANGGVINSELDDSTGQEVVNAESITKQIAIGEYVFIPSRHVQSNDESLHLAGWSLSPGGYPVITFNESYKPDGDCTLYAVWKRGTLAGTRLYGDLNNNARIDIGDGLCIQRHISAYSDSSVRMEHPDWIMTGYEYEAADVNHDAEISENDLTLIHQSISAQNKEETQANHPDWIITETFDFYSFDEIGPISIAEAAVTGIETKTYTGKEIIQALVVKIGDTVLEKDTDYTVAYSNNINVGTATVIITGKGNYKGTITKTFNINPAPISPATVTGIAAKSYTGKALTQSLVVKVGSTTLKANSEYTVAYKNNINAGKATVTITGKGNYTGTKTATFKINKAAQSITAKAGASRVAVGKTTTVSVTGNKGKKSYKSSNTAIATVTSAGKVTAKKVGTVKITATSAATSNYNATSKTVTIKVVPAATASLTAANQVKGIKLTWKKVTGANGYIIYRNNKKVKTITSGATVTWADTAANTNGTKYTYKVVAKGATGDSTLSRSRVIYRVARPAISSVANSASKKMTVKWGKNAKANGYQIQYSTSKTFGSGNKAVTVTSASTVSRVIGSLTKGKTYYVRIRTYKTVGSTKYWSIWSAARSVKISK